MVGIALKAFITLLTIATIVTLYLYYRSIFTLKILRNLYPRTMSFLHATPLLKKFLIEVEICLICFFPLLLALTSISYGVLFNLSHGEGQIAIFVSKPIYSELSGRYKL